MRKKVQLQQARRPRITVPARTALFMAGGYLRRKLLEQVRTVAFIICYLVFFRMLVLGGDMAAALEFALEIGMLVLGLTFFLEGLYLGLMPLGERVGLLLPEKSRLPAILVFSVLLGVSATLAEPAIAGLRGAGVNVVPWEQPLLYTLLELRPGLLVGAVAAGVGAAVALGILRFFFSLSIKPFIYVIIPLLLVLSVVFAGNRELATILGLAWDTGAVTTGVVTVPLVLALGIGVARTTGSVKGTGGGFGVVMLASAMPVLAVMIAAAAIAPGVPQPLPEQAYFAAPNRARAAAFLGGEEALTRLAFTRGSAAGRLALCGDRAARDAALRRLAAAPAALLGEMPLAVWLGKRAAPDERTFVRAITGTNAGTGAPAGAIGRVLGEEAGLAVRAILPLAALLAFVLYVFLRSRPRYQDEVGLGIVLACLGMILLTSGIRLGLSPLGDGIGRHLPVLLDPPPQELVVEKFSTNMLVRGIGRDGATILFLPYQGREGVRLLPWHPDRHNPVRGTYRIPLVPDSPLGRLLPAAGMALVLVFAFGLGYGTTLAEPALGAMGKTVEEMTVGTVTARGIIRAVSIGVGLGLVAGVARVLYPFSLTWILVPVYLLLLALTVFSEEDFTGIAWDSGGVTTGPVTVPLVLALGLGIGGSGAGDGFGILAAASAFPILTVLVYGLLIRIRQRRLIHAGSKEEGND